MSETFDRVLGSLSDLPDVLTTKPSTVMSVMPFLGNAQTHIVRTYKQRDSGYTIFLQTIDESGGQRIVIPPAAAEAIYRQRDALVTKSRKAAAAQAVRTKKEGR